jgi:hypothetical protein
MLNDTNVTYEVRYAFQEISESTWNGNGSYKPDGEVQIENNRIKLPVTIDILSGGQSRSTIFIGVRAVNKNGYSHPSRIMPGSSIGDFVPKKMATFFLTVSKVYGLQTQKPILPLLISEDSTAMKMFVPHSTNEIAT